MDQGIFYKTRVTIWLERNTNVDWVDNISNWRSTFGVVFSLGSGAISWSSKKQPTVALSSTEAKYRGMTRATYKAIWLKQLLKHFNELVNKPIRIYHNNPSSIQLAQNPVFHAWTKHIEVHYHYVQEHINARDIDLQNVGANQQTTNSFTKALRADKFHSFP